MRASTLTDLPGWEPARASSVRVVARSSRVVTQGEQPVARRDRGMMSSAPFRRSRVWYGLPADPATERWEWIVSLLIWASVLVALLWN